VTGERVTLLVGAAPVEDEQTYLPILHAASRIVAIDGGASLCARLGIVPDLVVGDMDSVRAEDLHAFAEAGTEIIRFDREKDFSDLEGAFEVCRARGWNAPHVTAASGGRFDHALAVAGALARHASFAPVLVEPSVRVDVLAPEGASRLSGVPVGTIVSVFPVLADARVSITGMAYPLDHARMPQCGSLGLSNVVVDHNAEVTVHEGVVLVVRTAPA